MTPRHSHEPRRPRPHPSGQSSLADLGDGERRAVDLPGRARSATDPPVHWVRVTCPECGVVRVKADRVVVRNCVDDGTWSYRARCSECDTIFLGATPENLALAALAAGVVPETWTSRSRARAGPARRCARPTRSSSISRSSIPTGSSRSRSRIAADDE